MIFPDAHVMSVPKLKKAFLRLKKESFTFAFEADCKENVRLNAISISMENLFRSAMRMTMEIFRTKLGKGMFALLTCTCSRFMLKNGKVNLHIGSLIISDCLSFNGQQML